MITVKDIREKDFSLQKRGYSEDEVDDFLDAIADQLGSLIRENREYLARAEQAEKQRDEAYEKLEKLENTQVKQEPVIQPVAAATEIEVTNAPAPSVDETAYFENLKVALREALISAQRIADDTVGEAKKKASEIVAEAEGYAKKVKEDSTSESAKVKADLEEEVRKTSQQLEELKTDSATYKEKFIGMIKAQLKALGEGEAE